MPRRSTISRVCNYYILHCKCFDLVNNTKVEKEVFTCRLPTKPDNALLIRKAEKLINDTSIRVLTVDVLKTKEKRVMDLEKFISNSEKLS